MTRGITRTGPKLTPEQALENHLRRAFPGETVTVTGSLTDDAGFDIRLDPGKADWRAVHKSAGGWFRRAGIGTPDWGRPWVEEQAAP